MSYIGDFAAAVTLDKKFTTRSFSTGIPTTLAGTPVISIYKDNSVTQSVTGVTLPVDFDGVTGLNNVRIDLSSDGTFYSAGSNFDIVITTGTVGGVSVVGETIGSFSIANRSALRPTTAGRTLDVSAGGEAGIDLANVGSPTTVLNLSGTAIASVNGAVGSVTGLTASNLDATISSRATPVQILTTALVESYAADGAAGTLSQLLFGLQAFLQERVVAGTTVTTKRLNGVTTAMTFTIDSTVSPTSITRAT